MPGTARILSIDGGGMRGLVPALVLRHLEKRIKMPIAEAFHLFTGTSTGAIVNFGLLNDTAEAVQRHYRVSGPQIFKYPLTASISLNGYLFPKYSPKNLERVMHAAFGDLRLSEAGADVLIPAYSLEHSRPHFFASWNARGEHIPGDTSPEDFDYLQRDVIRAATAVQTYFPPAHIKTVSGLEGWFADGLPSFNPAMSAFVYARTVLYPRANNIVIVSLGTGIDRSAERYTGADKWAKLGWASRLYELLLDGESWLADKHLSMLLGDNYFRFQFLLLPSGGVSHESDDASLKNMKALERQAASLVRKEQKKLKLLSELLKQPKTPREQLI